jgi:hypothetical protein
VNSKILLGELSGEFALGEKCLDIHAILARRHSINVDLSLAVGQQGAEAKLRVVCNMQTGYRSGSPRSTADLRDYRRWCGWLPL